METASFNYTHLAFLGGSTENLSDLSVGRGLSRLTSPTTVTIAVLLVFLLSPMILIGNSLLLVAIYRFKRLRTPSNLLVMSLATSDLGVGVFMPLGVYLEVNGARTFAGMYVCLFSYGVGISLCCASVLVMVAIAVDRFTSLAKPLRYNNLITHSAVERYVAVFWAYSALVGFSPLAYALYTGTDRSVSECSFGEMVAKPVQLFMFCSVYGPSCLVLVICYCYIYAVARGHARAIRSEQTRHQQRSRRGSGTAKYGLSLAITTGMFILLWMPFQVCMLMDVFLGTGILSMWAAVYLALPILSSSAFNPWVYGYRNSELRAASKRVIDDLLTAFGFTYRSQHVFDPTAPSVAATAGDAASFINHVQPRDCFRWKPDGDFLLVPIANAESSGVVSEGQKYFGEHPRIMIAGERHRGALKGSRSMVESIAMVRGSDVLVVKGNGLRHGASML